MKSITHWCTLIWMRFTFHVDCIAEFISCWFSLCFGFRNYLDLNLFNPDSWWVMKLPKKLKACWPKRWCIVSSIQRKMSTQFLSEWAINPNELFSPKYVAKIQTVCLCRWQINRLNFNHRWICDIRWQTNRPFLSNEVYMNASAKWKIERPTHHNDRIADSMWHLLLLT